MSSTPASPPNPSLYDKGFNFLRNNDELLGFIVGIITSLTFVLNKIGTIEIEESHLLIGVDILNILILVVALLSIKATILQIKGGEIENLKKHIILNNTDTFNRIRIRTNELIRQLVYCIRWFCIILAFFYFLQLYIDATQIGSYNTDIKSVLERDTDVIGLIIDGHGEATRYILMEVLTNGTNLFSAAYLILAFQVLFLITLDEKDNKKWRLKSYVPISIAVFITMLNILLLISNFTGTYLSNVSHMIRLICGVYNGIAMLLLFSRFISMEYFFQNSKKNYQRNFYFYGTIIGLPLYVVAQPLYGLFNAVEIGESPELFKSIVFLICFWGKLVFLLFVYTMLKKKWIHSYIFMVLSQKDTLLNISKDIDDIPNIDE